MKQQTLWLTPKELEAQKKLLARLALVKRELNTVAQARRAGQLEPYFSPEVWQFWMKHGDDTMDLIMREAT